MYTADIFAIKLLSHYSCYDEIAPPIVDFEMCCYSLSGKPLLARSFVYCLSVCVQKGDLKIKLC